MCVKILMSTYNGESYIKTQLESIKAQSYKNIELLIRDDGSSDGTIEEIESFCQSLERGENLKVDHYKGDNKGVIESFFDLINQTDLKAEYYAFSDQDDEWLPQKIERAVDVLQKLSKTHKNKPLLYCSDKIIVDKNLQPMDVTVSRFVRKIDFGNALVQDMCTGCTAVVNREMMELLRIYTPKQAIMHDWWMYLLGTGLGYVYYDKKAYIRYRQHGKNTSGAMTNRKQLFLYRFRQLLCERGGILKQVREFKEKFGLQVSSENQMLMNKLLNYNSFYGRLNLVAEKRIYRQKKSDDMILRMLYLIKKL